MLFILRLIRGISAAQGEKVGAVVDNSQTPPALDRSIDPTVENMEKRTLEACAQFDRIGDAIQAGLTYQMFTEPAYRLFWQHAETVIKEEPDADYFEIFIKLNNTGKLDEWQKTKLDEIQQVASLEDTGSHVGKRINLMRESVAIREAQNEILRLTEVAKDGNISDYLNGVLLVKERWEQLGIATNPKRTTWDRIPESRSATPYVDLTVEPTEDDFRAFLMGIPFAEDGDLIVISARLKSFKTSIIAAIACSTVGSKDADCLGFKIRGEGVFLIFDTEQSEKEILVQAKAMRRRLGVANLPDNIKFIGLREYAAPDRIIEIKKAINENKERGIAGIAVDGVSDLGGSINDDDRATWVVNFLTIAASEANAPLFGVIHLNHSDREAIGGARGHLGKEMERKAKSVICIEKDKDGVGTIYAEVTRGKPILKNEGQRIQFCQDKMMVVSIQGTPRDAKEAEEKFDVTELLYSVQEKTGALGWKYGDLIKQIMDIADVSNSTAKNRRTAMLKHGILKAGGQSANSVSLLEERAKL